MFRTWVLIEMTASQFLKRPENQKYVAQVKNQVVGFVSEYLHGNQVSRYVNWFLKELIRREIPVGQVSATLDNMWANVGDFVVAHVNHNQAQSKFNTMDYTYDQAVQDSDHWHMNMKGDERKKGAPGRSIVSLDDVPGFAGWKWVAMDRASCGKEADAMGHCGNAGGGHGENLLSLRDPQDRPHLTFINNRGVLGEMKGKGNSKPAQRYHPAIIKLLLSNEVGAVEGGGYAAGNNFTMFDLTPADQKYVRDRKPFIDRADDFRNRRDKIVAGLGKKARQQPIRTSTVETVGQAVRDLLDQKYPVERMYDTEPDREPHQVHQTGLWKVYTELLNVAYQKAKHESPDKLFAWMDKAVEAFVQVLVERDTEREQNQFFYHVSQIIRLDELVYRLMHQQPDVLRGAPKRSRFGSWKEYMEALRRYLDRQGYDLPGYRPDNHQISYEFAQKTTEEVARQGKEVAAKAEKSLGEMDPRLSIIARTRRDFTHDHPDEFFYGDH